MGLAAPGGTRGSIADTPPPHMLILDFGCFEGEVVDSDWSASHTSGVCACFYTHD